MKYNGGKNGSGTYQTIINQIPRCDIYMELFAGSAAIYRFMKPADTSILCELSKEQFMIISNLLRPGDILLNCDTVPNIDIFVTMGNLLQHCGKKVFMYLDPPYLMSTRSGKKKIYTHELNESGHIALLKGISCANFYVAISAYNNDLYNKFLSGWRLLEYQSIIRGGTRLESLYMNYEQPQILQDYSYLGNDFREREAIKRAISNAVQKFSTWSSPQLFALLQELTEKI